MLSNAKFHIRSVKVVTLKLNKNQHKSIIVTYATNSFNDLITLLA